MTATGRERLWPVEFPVLAGGAIVLRALQPRDTTQLLEVFGDPGVMLFWSEPAWRSQARAQEFVTGAVGMFTGRAAIPWAIAERDGDRLVGTCTLWNVNLVHGRAEVGFALRQSVWGRGWGTEALGLAAGFAFEELSLRRLEADVDPDNGASIRVLEKLGFRR
jgi:[ribosomal protein S5]-alanine N-acetyltransferase